MKYPYLVVQLESTYDYDDNRVEQIIMPDEYTERLVVDLEEEEADALNRSLDLSHTIRYFAFKVVPKTEVADRVNAAVAAALVAKKRKEDEDARYAARRAAEEAKEQARKIEEAKRVLATAKVCICGGDPLCACSFQKR